MEGWFMKVLWVKASGFDHVYYSVEVVGFVLVIKIGEIF
jgi:hypothetical protein